MMINRIQVVNIVWVVGSLALLYIGVRDGSVVSSFVWIVILFVIMYYMGENYKIVMDNKNVVGEPAKGQWDK